MEQKFPISILFIKDESLVPGPLIDVYFPISIFPEHLT